MNEHTDDIVLEARAITKRYPGTLALDRVDLPRPSQSGECADRRERRRQVHADAHSCRSRDGR